MPSIYQLKPRFQALLRPLVRRLHARGVTANQDKDIGFVRQGQEVEIKVETFTFSKYGVVNDPVTSISNDAIEDERLGLMYSARIQLKGNRIRINDQEIASSPGMTVRAEVKTDKRKVIDYFLSPLQEYQDESLNER